MESLRWPQIVPGENLLWTEDADSAGELWKGQGAEQPRLWGPAGTLGRPWGGRGVMGPPPGTALLPGICLGFGNIALTAA